MLRGGSGPSRISVSATELRFNGEARGCRELATLGQVRRPFSQGPPGCHAAFSDSAVQRLYDEASGYPEAWEVEQGMDLPVSVSPSQLDFYVDEKGGDTQVLSLFNVSEKTVYFQLMSNEPARYGVTGRSGIITAHCYSDIEVHYFDLSEEHAGTRDNLRIVLREQGDRILGFADVLVNVWPRRGRSDDENEEGAPGAVLQRGSTHTQQLPKQDRNNGWILSGHVPLVMFVVLACVVALLLPLEGSHDASSHPLFAYFSLSHEIKLVTAYILDYSGTYVAASGNARMFDGKCMMPTRFAACQLIDGRRSARRYHCQCFAVI
ncbi:motile sperm domain-containing protein 1 isoform X3 [Rhipicephalus microplus]|uniref:motile sperm domain-containing protein 1 isoform X3 n=1 Tax=Rhipicephalus microplus TaxID=6941 RepID=UPI003F6D93DC